MAYFIPFGSNDKEAYDKGVSVAELFPVNVTGIVSGNDGVSIAPTKAELIRRMDIVKNATEEKDISIYGADLAVDKQLRKSKMMYCPEAL